jgi:SAM-dependent methyltransferase
MSADEIELETVPCPLCRADDWKPVGTGRDLLCGVPGEYQVVRCRQCRHVYLNPRPTVASIGLCYPDDYAPHQVADAPPSATAADVESTGATAKTPWYLRGPVRRIPGLRRFYRWLTDQRTQVIPSVDDGPKCALEIGCAVGSFLEKLRAAGWDAQGVEPSAKPAEIARARGFEVHTGTLESARLPDGRFDAAFAWMVVEHLHDPVATLQEVRRVLKPDGWFAFSVPNFACWERVVFGRYWYALGCPIHLQQYTPRSLRRLLDSSGFDLVQMIHQRNGLNIIGSTGLVLEHCFPRLSLGHRLVRYPDHPTILPQLAMSPLLHALAWMRQGGRLTVVARAKPTETRS